MRVAVARARGLPLSAVAIVTAVALLAAVVASGGSHSELPAVALIAVLLAIGFSRIAERWSTLLTGLVLAVILIPSDGRYTVAGGLPFKLEPYRIVIGLLIIGWIVAMLVDPRVRARATKFEGPVILILLATLGSDVFNPARVGAEEANVIKALWFFACLILFLYLAVSVIRTREVVDRLIAVLVTAGAIEGLDGVLQRKTGTDLFDHLRTVLPFLQYNPGVTVANLTRGGSIRATASAGQPIELSSAMSILMPLAAYLAITRKQKRWWVAMTFLLMGDFAGGSRTGIIGIVIVAGIFLWLRPRQTLRCWPALIPTLAIVHVFSPGSLGGVIEGFFPSGGLIANQSGSFVGPGGVVENNTRLSRWGPSMHVYLDHNPLFGEGYGTRTPGGATLQQRMQILDDQWLGTLLETGLLGILGYIWLFLLGIRRLGKRAKLERGTPEGWLSVALAASIGAFASSMLFYDAFSFVQATFLAFTIIAFASVILQLPPVIRTLPPAIRSLQP